CLKLRRLCFFSSRRRHTRCYRDWSSDVCSSDLSTPEPRLAPVEVPAWIAARARIHGVKLDGDAVAMLASAVGSDTERVEQEIQRSEERRVGKEGRCRWGGTEEKEKQATEETRAP